MRKSSTAGKGKKSEQQIWRRNHWKQNSLGNTWLGLSLEAHGSSLSDLQGVLIPCPLLFICGSLFLLPCDFPLRKCWQRPMLLWNVNDVTAIPTVLIWVSLTAIFFLLTFAVKSTHINDDWSSEQEGGSDSSNINWHTHEKRSQFISQVD